jgi:hypothetical protein
LGEKVNKPFHPAFKTRYMFSVQADIGSYRLGESPAGFRIDIEYKSGKVRTNADLFFKSWRDKLEELDSKPLGLVTDKDRTDWLRENRRQATWPKGMSWFGLDGDLISGSDRVLVRNDGVTEMNGRVTLREETWPQSAKYEAGGGGLINTELSTVIDLGTAVPSFEEDTLPDPPDLQPREIYDLWKESRGPAELHFGLAVRFAAAQASQAWAGEVFRSQSFQRFLDLPRHQYAANVRAKLMDGLLNHIELDVWRIAFENLPLLWQGGVPLDSPDEPAASTGDKGSVSKVTSIAPDKPTDVSKKSTWRRGK